MKVYINPTYTGADRADGGIRRVVEAQQRYLPEFGIQVTSTPDDADLIANHGAMIEERPGVPMVNHCHGLMWSSYGFGPWGDDVNKHVIDSMVRADAITAPSRWVAHAISRGMLAKPEVVYHGVDAEDWAHDLAPLGYVLWNKARADFVSDPRDMNDVAELLPDVPFLSTFGQPTANVRTIGAVSYEQMKPLVQQAGVYLATARETFGIGTLEALAAGVPVAGWRYGGQEEIIVEGETGYLAPYGDYDELARCIRRCLDERARLSRAAQSDVRARWGWQAKVGQYAALYTRVYEAHHQERPKVSVVVTCHNLARYLSAALGSVIDQTMEDWECVVVDDQSTDDTEDVFNEWYRVNRFFDSTMQARYLRTPANLKLSGARNYGWQHAKGKYILFLDADDMLAPNALDVLSTALDQDTATHIAFGHLDTCSDDGTHQQRNPWPGSGFDWRQQIAHLNQLPYAAMVRREVLERSGGYRSRDWRAEDASLWTRLTSFGFRAAKVTEASTLIYRLRSDSKSRGEDSDGDWTAWFPWRLAADPYGGLRAMEKGVWPNPQIVPFGAQGQPPAPLKAWPVHHHQEPVVSVIIPVGPGHAQSLIDALDSVQAQTMPFWECIVVNDSGAEIDLTPWPWARLHTSYGTSDVEGRRSTHPQGAGKARNLGLAIARAPLALFLDADDVLVPRALEVMLRAYQTSGGKYVYSDWLSLEDDARIDGQMAVHPVEEYDARVMLQGLRHAVTALVPVEWLRAVGGFDEQLKVFEDWDLYCKLAIMGYCGARAAEPLLIYRHTMGQRTRAALRPRASEDDETPRYTELGEAAALAIADRYAAYRTGEESVMGCCGGNQNTNGAVSGALNDMLNFATGQQAIAPAQGLPSGPVRMEFIGEQYGAQSYIGASGTIYRAGRDPNDRFHDVLPVDVQRLLDLGTFRIVPQEALAQAASTEPLPMELTEPRSGRRRR